MDAYDSDAEDFGPRSTVSKYAIYRSAGAESMLKMLERATEDRHETKRRSKELELTKQNPKTERKLYLWWTRFCAFRANTLKRPPEAVTTGQDLERFMPAIARSVVPRFVSKAASPSARWLQGGVIRVIEGATFYEKGFQLTKQERARISSVLAALLQEGVITNAVKQTREWVGVALVARMIAALFEHALQKGCLNWDCTIHRALCIVLISALACRTGDVAKDLNDGHEYPSLIWEDITITMVEGGDTINEMEAVVKLRNEKLDKLDPQKNRTVRLAALKDGAHNMLCPIKLLLILALRTGAVAETRIESLVSSVVARASRRVIWKYPKRPVLAKLAVRGSWLLLDEAATNHHMVGVVHTASKMAGLLRYIHPHDLRRGSGRDLSHLPHGVLKKANLQAVGRGVGHDVRNAHVTLDYVGDDENDTWTARVENPHHSRIKAIPVATAGYEKPKISRAMSAQWCQEHNLDPNVSKDLDQARSAIEKQQWAGWMEAQLEARDRVPNKSHETSRPEKRTATRSRGSNTAHKTSRKRSLVLDEADEEPGPMVTRIRRSMGENDEGEAAGTLAVQPPTVESTVLSQPVGPTVLGQQGPEGEFDFEMTFDDPQALNPDDITHAENLIGAISNGPADDDDDDDENVLLQTLPHTDADEEASSDTVPDELLAMDALSFVRKYATINVFAFHTKRVAGEDERIEKLSGNGKDTAVQFAYPCKNEHLGCDKTFVTSSELRNHQLICNPAKIRSLQSTPRPFECATCGMRFAAEKNMKVHVRNMHDWTPRTCQHPGCTSTQLFMARKEYKLHKENVHLNHQLKCPVVGCKSETLFRLPNYLAKHVRSVHKLADKDVTHFVKLAQANKESQSA